MTSRNRSYIAIYKQHYGDIPKYSLGRSYDIHHIDGNPHNNDISNLIALRIEEHYKIHKEQGDIGAAWLVSKRLNLGSDELSRLATHMNLSRSKNGTHWSQIASQQGIHPFQSSNFQKKLSKISMEKGTHACLQQWTCEICGKTGQNLTNYSRYHGENCGADSKVKGRVWVNNGTVTKLAEKTILDTLLNEGWIEGRGSTDLTPKRLNSKGTQGRARPYVRKTSRPYNKKK